MTDSTLPPGLPTAPNDRPCAACKHFDERVRSDGLAFCHRFCIWRDAGGTVLDCSGAERADGKESPFAVKFGKNRE